MESPVEEAGDMLEQTLLKCYDKEAVAKLLDKRMKSAQPQSQWDAAEDDGPVAKRSKISSGSQDRDEKGSRVSEGSQEERRSKICDEKRPELSSGFEDREETRGALKVFQAEKEYLLTKVSMLEAELRTEKSYRAHYEEKSLKLGRNVKRMEDVVISQKIQIRAFKQQPNNSKIEQMKAKMLIRIGDIEKDTIETKAAVVSELKNISDIKKPLENVSKLVEFLQAELEARDKKIEEYENLLGERGKTAPENETEGSGSTSTLPPNELNKNSYSVDVSDHSQEASNRVESDLMKTTEGKTESIVEMSSKLESSLEIISRLKDDINKISSKNNKLKDKKEALGEEYDKLERYLTKIEMKLDKRESKLEKLSSEYESCQFERESLKELNDNLLKQLTVLKEESVLLKDTIAQKEAKLLRSELKLKLSKEELKLDVVDSFKQREEHMKNETVGLRRDLESANLKINNLLQAKHRLEIEVDNLKLEIYTSVRNQKVEMKKMRKIHESSAQHLSNTVKLLKIQLGEKQEGLEVNNNNNKVGETVIHERRGVANSDDAQSKDMEKAQREGVEGQAEENLGVGDHGSPELGKEFDCEDDVDESETVVARHVICEVVNELVVKVVEM